jgi:hypothetical protein
VSTEDEAGVPWKEEVLMKREEEEIRRRLPFVNSEETFCVVQDVRLMGRGKEEEERRAGEEGDEVMLVKEHMRRVKDGDVSSGSGEEESEEGESED